MPVSGWHFIKSSTCSQHSGGATGGLGGFVPPNSQSRQKLSMKNGIKLVGYTFRLKNYVKIPPPHFSQIFQSWRRHCLNTVQHTVQLKGSTDLKLQKLLVRFCNMEKWFEELRALTAALANTVWDGLICSAQRIQAWLAMLF